MRVRYQMAVLALAVMMAACSKNTAVKIEANYTGDTAKDIVQAMKASDLATVRDMLDKDAGVLTTVDPHGRTLLHIAVQLNNPDLVNLLIDHGMDPNILDKQGMTPLSALQEAGIPAVQARQALVKRGGTT